MKKKIKTSTLILIVFLTVCVVRMIAIDIIIAKEFATIENIEEIKAKNHIAIELNKSYDEEGDSTKGRYKIEVKKYTQEEDETENKKGD